MPVQWQEGFPLVFHPLHLWQKINQENQSRKSIKKIPLAFSLKALRTLPLRKGEVELVTHSLKYYSKKRIILLLNITISNTPTNYN